MSYIAHATIELPDGKKLRRGDKVDPNKVEGFDALVEGGSISDQPYDPEADKSPMPDVVEIDGVRYIKCADDCELEAEDAS